MRTTLIIKFLIINIGFSYFGLKAQSFENTVIIFEISSKYGDLETVKEYYLLEPVVSLKNDSNLKSNKLVMFNKNYQLYQFEVSLFYLNCCKDERREFGFLDQKGDADYSKFIKKTICKKNKEKKITVSKVKMEYCKCTSYHNDAKIICTPKKILSNHRFNNDEKLELKKSLLNIFESYLTHHD